MTATDLRPAPPAPALPAVQRRRPLPGGRAVVGGFLVAAAAVGIFAAYQQASRPARTRYVAAARALVAGHTVEAGDLTTVALALPDGSRQRAFTSPRSLIGHLLVADVAKGELVQRSALAPNGFAQPGQIEVSFTLDPARSLGDRIGPGDVVDLLSTADGQTGVLAHGVRIIDRETRGGGGFIYTVGLADQASVAAVVGANVGGTLSMVRVNGVAAGAPATGPPTTRRSASGG